MRKISISPIGVAKNKVRKPRFGNFADEVSEIVVDRKFARGLEGIEGYSHLLVLYWMDRVNGITIRHRPQGNPEVPEVGIFSCRCPTRPNPVGITTVKLIGVKGNRIRVRGLDVVSNTPVIDIKPYWPQYDEVKKAKVPKWVYRLKF